jgi:hypothetical protein
VNRSTVTGGLLIASKFQLAWSPKRPIEPSRIPDNRLPLAIRPHGGHARCSAQAIWGLDDRHLLHERYKRTTGKNGKMRATLRTRIMHSPTQVGWRADVSLELVTVRYG